jgi:hypothetical protein
MVPVLYNEYWLHIRPRFPAVKGLLPLVATSRDLEPSQIGAGPLSQGQNGCGVRVTMYFRTTLW